MKKVVMIFDDSEDTEEIISMSNLNQIFKVFMLKFNFQMDMLIHLVSVFI